MQTSDLHRAAAHGFPWNSLNQLWTRAECPVFPFPIARLAEAEPLMRRALAIDETSCGLIRNLRAATPVVSPPANVQAIALWRRDRDRNQFDQSI